MLPGSSFNSLARTYAGVNAFERETRARIDHQFRRDPRRSQSAGQCDTLPHRPRLRAHHASGPARSQNRGDRAPGPVRPRRRTLRDQCLRNDAYSRVRRRLTVRKQSRRRADRRSFGSAGSSAAAR
jgi:hypothetical protein